MYILPSFRLHKVNISCSSRKTTVMCSRVFSIHLMMTELVRSCIDSEDDQVRGIQYTSIYLSFFFHVGQLMTRRTSHRLNIDTITDIADIPWQVVVLQSGEFCMGWCDIAGSASQVQRTMNWLTIQSTTWQTRVKWACVRWRRSHMKNILLHHCRL